MSCCGDCHGVRGIGVALGSARGGSWVWCKVYVTGWFCVFIIPRLHSSRDIEQMLMMLIGKCVPSFVNDLQLRESLGRSQAVSSQLYQARLALQQ